MGYSILRHTSLYVECLVDAASVEVWTSQSEVWRRARVVVVLARLAGGLVVSLPRVQPAGGAAATVAAFCEDEVAQRYADAYALFTPQYQAITGERLWLQVSQVFDRKFGRTLSCGLPAGYELRERGRGPLRIPLDIRREHEHAVGDAETAPSLMLVRVGTQWQIDQVHLPLVVPSSRVAMRFV